MRIISRTTRFKKDYKRAKRRGKNLNKLRAVVEALVEGKSLEVRYRDHQLAGMYVGARECHLEPDWLLIYEETDNELILIRTGTHADLFE